MTKEENRARCNAFYHANKHRLKKDRNRRSLEWYYNNKERVKKTNAAWRKRKAEQIRQYERRMRATPQFKFRKNLSSRLHEVLTKYGEKRGSTRVCKLIGCTKAVLMQWLESQFSEGMSWENYGYWGWHIDHIKPCAAFNLADPLERSACFHYTNLQPLWQKDNFKKSDTWPEKPLSEL